MMSFFLFLHEIIHKTIINLLLSMIKMKKTYVNLAYYK